VSQEGSEFVNRGDLFSFLLCSGDNSSENKGLFLLSFLGLATASIDRLSPNGAALIASHEARIHATSPETWGPGIAEQYALQLDKLHAGTASTVIGSMPVYLSHPSASTSLPSIRLSPLSRLRVLILNRQT
jgi:hypothetical protein